MKVEISADGRRTDYKLSSVAAACALTSEGASPGDASMTRMFLTLAAMIGLATGPAMAADPKIEGDWEASLKVTP